MDYWTQFEQAQLYQILTKMEGKFLTIVALAYLFDHITACLPVLSLPPTPSVATILRSRNRNALNSLSTVTFLGTCL